MPDDLPQEIGPDAPVPSGTPFGPHFLACHHLVRENTGPHADARCLTALVTRAEGSGENGPHRSDFGLHISTEKRQWTAEAAPGEVGGLYVTLRQGDTSDAGGVLVDHAKTAGGAGSSVGVEVAGQWVDRTGATIQRVQTIVNFLEGPGGFSDGRGHGFWAEAQEGRTSSAFHAGNGDGSFDAVLTAAASRAPDSVFFKIDGFGNVRNNGGTQKAVSYGFLGDIGTGMFRLGPGWLGLATGGTVRLQVDANGNTAPAHDAAYACGLPGARWSVVHSATGVMTGSGEQQKAEIQPIDPALLRALARVPLSQFKRTEDAGKWHVGILFEDLERALRDEGLDPSAYAMLEGGRTPGVRYEQILLTLLAGLRVKFRV